MERSDTHCERVDAREDARELADWEKRMTETQDEPEDKSPPIRIPEDEEEAVEMVAEDYGEEWAEEHRELIIAQAKLIGDL